MDRVIDFNEIRNRVNDKDVDKFESYIYNLYYKMAEGKLSMADFNREISSYMEKNNISQDKFIKMQTKLMERYGLDTKAFEEQLKALGIDSAANGVFDYEKNRRNMSFQEKYKSRLKTKGVNEYFITNEKNKIVVLLDDHNVIVRSEGKIDLADNELNEFLCSYKKVIENDNLKITICEFVKEYDY